MGKSEKRGYEIGMIGLGIMGRNFVLNMADHGYSVAGYDIDRGKVDALRKEAGSRKVYSAGSLQEFMGLLLEPKAVMMLVPAGPPVDSVIKDVVPHLKPGNLIIDGGNSYFRDTDRREKGLREKGIGYLGVGISGGEHGARYGPSMMPGGSKTAYEHVRAIFEAASAHVNEEPCVTYLGPGSAGHYVKMVHNGIEYGLLQLIAETYDIMKRGLDLNNDELHAIYKRWNEKELNGYLVEITANIFSHTDEKTGKRLIDVILDAARQKGTGMWTSQDALELQVPVPTVDIAVAMRNLSAIEKERREASKVLSGPVTEFKGDRDHFIEKLRNAIYTAMIITYTQGMNQLRAASRTYKYGFDLEAVARIWRGGCIIRAALLEDIRTAYRSQPDLPSLLVNSHFAQAVVSRQDDLRTVVSTASELGIPAPALMVSLAYFDGYRSSWLPANLIQAQRDYFGAHTYEREDAEGVFHTQWE
jgi:6-phosphogluconate dehydrogenase